MEEITRDPKLATDEDREEPFQPPFVFKARLPVSATDGYAPGHVLGWRMENED